MGKKQQKITNGVNMEQQQWKRTTTMPGNHEDGELYNILENLVLLFNSSLLMQASRS